MSTTTASIGSTERGRRFLARHPGAWRVRKALYEALTRGEIHPGPCCSCGTRERVRARYLSYELPLRFDWLCPCCMGKERRAPTP